MLKFKIGQKHLKHVNPYEKFKEINFKAWFFDCQLNSIKQPSNYYKNIYLK